MKMGEVDRVSYCGKYSSEGASYSDGGITNVEWEGIDQEEEMYRLRA